MPPAGQPPEPGHDLLATQPPGEPPEATEAATLAWLVALLTDEAALPLPAAAAQFLGVTLARYLDPFLDGDVPSDKYQERSAGYFSTQLAAAWAASGATGPPTLASECVVAQYACHCVSKLNACLGFGLHSPGGGRQPISTYARASHVQRVATSVAEAIEVRASHPWSRSRRGSSDQPAQIHDPVRQRAMLTPTETPPPPSSQRDFAPGERRIYAIEALTQDHLEQLTRRHLAFLYESHDALNAALSKANADGEENKRKERMRIFGISVNDRGQPV